MFSDRVEAGKLLAAASRLQRYKGKDDAIVFGVPRGGVVTAAVLAETLRLPLDVIVARKITNPDNPEFAIGALTALGPAIWNEEMKRYFPEEDLNTMEETARKEAGQRLKKYREAKPLPDLRRKTAIIVDDGLATGMTVWAAALHAKEAGAQKIVVAVPVASRQAVRDLKKIADEVIVLDVPETFFAVGQFYRQFDQVNDETVARLLQLNGQPGK